MLLYTSAVFLLLATTHAAPVDPPAPDCKDQPVTDVYDQRQNGTENYRINVKGVVILIAPAENMNTAALLSDLGGPADPVTEDADPDLKPPAEPITDQNSTTTTPQKRSKVKVLNLLKLLKQYPKQ